jgi:hypothetical protein
MSGGKSSNRNHLKLRRDKHRPATHYEILGGLEPGLGVFGPLSLKDLRLLRDEVDKALAAEDEELVE